MTLWFRGFADGVLDPRVVIKGAAATAAAARRMCGSSRHRGARGLEDGDVRARMNAINLLYVLAHLTFAAGGGF